jgi:hypothetical protein
VYLEVVLGLEGGHELKARAVRQADVADDQVNVAALLVRHAQRFGDR